MRRSAPSVFLVLTFDNAKTRLSLLQLFVFSTKLCVPCTTDFSSKSTDHVPVNNTKQEKLTWHTIPLSTERRVVVPVGLNRFVDCVEARTVFGHIQSDRYPPPHFLAVAVQPTRRRKRCALNMGGASSSRVF